MNIKFYIYNIEQHNEYDSVQIQRIIKVENENTLEGFKSEIEAENWISEFGKNDLEYVILKSIKT
jgi:hypothetical protein